MDNEEFDFEAKYADDLDVLEDLENEQFCK